MREFIGGIVVGVLICVITTGIVPDSYYNIVTNAKEACERDLPRSEHCEIMAIHISKD